MLCFPLNPYHCHVVLFTGLPTQPRFGFCMHNFLISPIVTSLAVPSSCVVRQTPMGTNSGTRRRKRKFPLLFVNCDCGRIEIDHLYGLRCRGWYCNPEQHSLCRPARPRDGRHNSCCSGLQYQPLQRRPKLRKSHYSPKLGGMMQFTMKQITVWNSHTQLMFTFSDLGRPRLLSFSERLVCRLFITVVPVVYLNCERYLSYV